MHALRGIIPKLFGFTRDLFHRVARTGRYMFAVRSPLGMGGSHGLDFGQQMDRGSFDAGHPANSVVGIHSGMKRFIGGLD
jgi:hypothetical protein